jgi:hypothetical protein
VGSDSCRSEASRRDHDAAELQRHCRRCRCPARSICRRQLRRHAGGTPAGTRLRGPRAFAVPLYAGRQAI